MGGSGDAPVAAPGLPVPHVTFLGRMRGSGMRVRVFKGAEDRWHPAVPNAAAHGLKLLPVHAAIG